MQGVLLGLVVDNRLEITNCFPFPRHNEEEDFDEGFLSLITSLKYLSPNHKKKMKGWNPKNFLFFFFKSLLYFTVQYQMEMMRNLRHVNIDHLHVGWYQSTLFGSFISRAFVDSQFNYQHSIEESVVLIYGKAVTFDQFFYLKKAFSDLMNA